MPRIAVAIFVVVAVSVSIGINIARYPAVFQSAGVTHESFVSDDTMDVSETAETEGTVAVKPVPALPDANLVQWNVPLQSGNSLAMTEAVPYVASSANRMDHVNYSKSPSESITADGETAETSETANRPSTELNEYEVQPYHPYTSQPSVANSAQTQPEAPVETTYSETYDKYRNRYERDASTPESDANHDDRRSNSLGGDSSSWNSENRESHNTYYAPASDSPARENGYDTPGRTRETDRSSTTSSRDAQPEQEDHPPGFWPATVAETFRYRSESSEPSDAFSHRSSSATVCKVSSSKVTTASESVTFETEAAHQRDDPNVKYYEDNNWQAVTPMVAIQDNHEDASLDTHVERLPVVRGADTLPGALPPQQMIDYPVAK